MNVEFAHDYPFRAPQVCIGFIIKATIVTDFSDQVQDQDLPSQHRLGRQVRLTSSTWLKLTHSICLGILKTDQWKPSTKMTHGQLTKLARRRAS